MHLRGDVLVLGHEVGSTSYSLLRVSTGAPNSPCSPMDRRDVVWTTPDGVWGPGTRDRRAVHTGGAARTGAYQDGRFRWPGKHGSHGPAEYVPRAVEGR